MQNRTKLQIENSIYRVKHNLQLDMHEATARKHVKCYLIHTYGNICSICGISEWQGQPAPLICDHINGDTKDNRVENFRLVCCNCDAQLPTYKSKNRGKGRSYDKEYHRKRGRVVDGSCLENNRG